MERLCRRIYATRRCFSKAKRCRLTWHKTDPRFSANIRWLSMLRTTVLGQNSYLFWPATIFWPFQLNAISGTGQFRWHQWAVNWSQGQLCLICSEKVTIVAQKLGTKISSIHCSVLGKGLPSDVTGTCVYSSYTPWYYAAVWHGKTL